MLPKTRTLSPLKQVFHNKKGEYSNDGSNLRRKHSCADYCNKSKPSHSDKAPELPWYTALPTWLALAT